VPRVQRITNDLERQSLGGPEVTVPARPPFRDIQHLGEGVWLNEGKIDHRVILIGGRPHIRFLDHLYLPAPTHAANSSAGRGHYSIPGKREPTPIPSSLTTAGSGAYLAKSRPEVSGPILEVGPSFEPALGPDGSRVVLCDLDEKVNAQNAATGYAVTEPRSYAQYEDARFRPNHSQFCLPLPD